MITTITSVRVVPSPGRGVWGHPIPDEVHVYLACGHKYWWAGSRSWAPEVGEKRRCEEPHPLWDAKGSGSRSHG